MQSLCGQIELLFSYIEFELHKYIVTLKCKGRMERLQCIQRERIWSVKSYLDFSTIMINDQSVINRSSIVTEINSRNLRCVNRIFFSQHVVDKWIFMSRTLTINMELFGTKYVPLNLRYLHLYHPIKISMINLMMSYLLMISVRTIKMLVFMDTLRTLPPPQLQ